jgi:hypothetical protein
MYLRKIAHSMIDALCYVIMNDVAVILGLEFHNSAMLSLLTRRN